MRPILPALGTSASMRYLTFGALYFAQGIPQGLQLYAIPAWMAVHGAGAATVGGYVGICTLPWTFKLIAGPLMDRYGFLPMGRRRPWLLCAGLGMVLTLLALSLVPDPLHHMGLFMAVSFVGNCFGAVQDVATDGLAVDITPEDQQARANGVMWGAKIAGVSATLTAGTWAINTFGFGHAVAVLALVLLAVLVLPSLLRERLFPWSHGSISKEAEAMKAESWKEVMVAMKRVLPLRNSLVGCGCFMLWGLINGLIDTQWPLFTIQQLGWDNSAYANLTAGAGMVSAIAAMLMAGWLADRVGKLRISTIYLAVMAAGWLMLGLAPQLWPHSGYIPAFIYGSQCVVTFYQVATLALAMSLCWARVAATQFTLYMVCNNVGVALGAALLGPLHTSLSWSGLFLLFSVALTVLTLAWQFMRLGRHKTELEHLEQHHMERITASVAPAGSLVPDLGLPGPAQ